MQAPEYDDSDDDDDDDNNDSSVTRKRTFSEISEKQPHDETEIGEQELDTDWSSQEETEFSSDEEMPDSDAKFNKRNRVE